MQGLGNPLLITSLATTALSSSTKVVDFTKKNWKYMLAGGGAIFVGWLVYDKFIKATPEDKSKLPVDNRFPTSTLSQQEAAVIAEELFQAMTYTGTDFNRIKNALNGLTYNDFVKVSDAFGLKYYDTIFGTEGLPYVWPKLSLHEWLANELSDKEMAVIQAIMPNVITQEVAFSVGKKVIAATNGTTVYNVEKNGNNYLKLDKNTTYNAGKEIGEIIAIQGDYLIVDKNWSWNDVMVHKSKVTAL